MGSRKSTHRNGYITGSTGDSHHSVPATEGQSNGIRCSCSGNWISWKAGENSAVAVDSYWWEFAHDAGMFPASYEGNSHYDSSREKDSPWPSRPLSESVATGNHKLTCYFQ